MNSELTKKKLKTKGVSKEKFSEADISKHSIFFLFLPIFFQIALHTTLTPPIITKNKNKKTQIPPKTQYSIKNDEILSRKWDTENVCSSSY